MAKTGHWDLLLIEFEQLNIFESQSFSVQKIASEEIKEVLERIKKAQEQVLDELRRN